MSIVGLINFFLILNATCSTLSIMNISHIYDAANFNFYSHKVCRYHFSLFLSSFQLTPWFMSLIILLCLTILYSLL